MACNVYVEDVGEDWELLGGDEITIPAASEADEGMILGRHVEEHTHDERINRAENKVGGSIQGDERTLCAESEVQDHALPIRLNASNVIETKFDRNDEAVLGDTGHHLYSSANTANGAITGNESKNQTQRLIFETIYTLSDQFQIDVETEKGRIKGSGEMSNIPAFMNAESAMGDNIHDDNSVQQKHKHNHALPIRPTTSKTIKIDCDINSDVPQSDHTSINRLGWIRKSLLRAIKDENEEEAILLLENDADANSEGDWRCALIYAQRCGLKEAVKLLGQGAPACSSTQVLRGSSQITIEGVFPLGTTLDISTPNGTRQIITSGQPMIAHNVSAGPRSFQFIGDSTGLSAFLKRAT